MSNARTITAQSDLQRLCEQLREAEAFAFDTEFIRDDTFEPVLCLLQVAVAGEVFLIDPVAEVDVSVFWEIVASPAPVKVVHAGKEDFDLCLRSVGKPPRTVFDVQLAAGLVGFGYPLSLARLVLAVLNKRIGKGQTLTDWLRRPLTDDQIRYAIEDVKFLPAIHRKLDARLAECGRSAWAHEEFAVFEDAAFYRPPAADRLVRLKGSRRLDPLGLAVLEQLVQWRENWAKQKNRPPRALMRDDVLVELARRRPRKASDMEVMRGFHQARNPQLVREVLDLIRDTEKSPRSSWPTLPETPEDTPLTRVAVDLMSAVARFWCHEYDVSYDLLGSTTRLRELLDFCSRRGDGPPALLEGWRGEFIGRQLVDLLEGRSEVRARGRADKPLMEIVPCSAPIAAPEP